MEHFLEAGKQVKRVTEEMGLAWDVSDYQPLPDWKPCRAHEDRSTDHDLFVVNYKLPFHTFTHTAENAWLDDLSQNYPNAYDVLINSETAKRKRIRDGDAIWLETKQGFKVKGTARVSERVHPEVLAIAGVFGRWAKAQPIAKGKGTHWNTLVPLELDSMDMLTTAVDACVKVKVYR